MATEYGLQDGDNQADLARELIDRAGPDRVTWSPRPDTPGGGVYVVDDDEAAADVLRARRIRREEEASRIEEARRAADERDQKADETGMTPAELGFPANAGTDPGSAGQARLAQDAVDGKVADADPNPAALAKAEAIRAKDAEGATVQETTDAETQGAYASTDEDGEDNDSSDEPKKETPAQRRARVRAEREAAQAEADKAANTDK